MMKLEHYYVRKLHKNNNMHLCKAQGPKAKSLCDITPEKRKQWIVVEEETGHICYECYGLRWLYKNRRRSVYTRGF